MNSKLIIARRLFFALYGPIIVLSFFSTWWTARLVLGRWPKPSLDDPGQIPWVPIPYWVTSGLIILIPLAVAVPLILVARSIYRRSSHVRVELLCAVGVLGIILAIAVLRSDPYSISTWYMD
jgi:hypothetical protein